MFSRLLFKIVLFVTRSPKWLRYGALAVFVGLPLLSILGGTIFRLSDWHESRGAKAISYDPSNTTPLAESFSTPEYLDQGWNKNDSVWFYNTTQGSAFMPYDFLLVLEQPGTVKINCALREDGETAPWFLCDNHIDRYRYLPQDQSIFNPDALPVGFAKEPYQGKDYVGLTCAACHTTQINFKNPGEATARALRIDGAPAYADMVKFLTELTRAMKLTRDNAAKLETFVNRVVALDNDYNDNAKGRAEVVADLKKWIDTRNLYNTINDPTFMGKDKETGKPVHKKIEYGFARVDAFGRIYNRVLQHAINKKQLKDKLITTMSKDGVTSLLTPGEIDKVLNGNNDPVGDLILRDGDFTKIIRRLESNQSGYPALDNVELRIVRDKIFNAPTAPVSFPFLWDMTRSDYVQWNGLASNGGGGPIGRNAGEVIGVFAILDWKKDTRWLSNILGFSFSSFLSGQSKKKEQIYFKSSVDLFNLQRLESHLGKLESPAWPFCKNKQGNHYLPSILPTDRNDFDKGCNSGDHQFDTKTLERGRLLYAEYCQSCHDVIIPDAWDRLMVSNLTRVDQNGTDNSDSNVPSIGTDKVMAMNSVTFTGKSGNFKDTYQTVGVGKLVVKEDAPVVQVLTAATAGTIGTSDPDKWWPRRFVEYIYALGMTFLDNPIKESIKAGNYNPDTTAGPYSSLVSYRARSLNGIWATAPYLHNGSVPNLYELLLPPKRQGDIVAGRCKKYRSTTGFMLGKRAFDPANVGFISQGYDGFYYDINIPGNTNTGHEYGACDMTDQERMDLLEYLKSL